MARIVYEAVNETRKEVFLGTAGSTDFSLEHIQSSHRAVAPHVIAHWDFNSEKVLYKILEEDLHEIEVPGFLDSYMRSMLKPGWTLIVE